MLVWYKASLGVGRASAKAAHGQLMPFLIRLHWRPFAAQSGPRTSPLGREWTPMNANKKRFFHLAQVGNSNS
jgi:hypothetical protein